MKVTAVKKEDDLAVKDIIKAVNKKMDDVLRVVDALNLGRTEVKSDGVSNFQRWNNSFNCCR